MSGVVESVGPSVQQQVVEYVVKIASRCNLSCDHCYVYRDPDRGWLAKPLFIEPSTARAAAGRIAEHAAYHRLARVAVILHGGEPLLLPAARLAQIMAAFRSVIEPVCLLELRMQSNGILLTPEIAEVLADHHVVVGISLDGDALANDRHRIYLNGTSSHTQVLRALELLRTAPYRSLYGGILCTIDVANDPIRVYEALLEEEPPRIDFLLPHATWDDPPPGRDGGSLRYAEWLLAIYERWSADGRPVRIRIFDSILALGEGDASGTESLGADTSAIAVVEVDGTWERVDSLKMVSEEAPRTGLDVHRHSVDEFLARAGALGRDGGELAPTCRTCRVVDTCGGGLYAHRFGRGNGYANPSVYCADLFRLIDRVQRRPAVRPAPTSVSGRRVLRRHLGRAGELSPSTLLDLASGRPTTDSVRLLAKAEYAIDRALVAGMAGDQPAGPGRVAWDLLGEIDERAPAAVREVLTHPFVRVRARRILTSPRVDARTDPAPTTALMTSLAAAAAVRAGFPTSLDVRLDRGTLCLPGIGALHLPGVAGAVVSLTGDPSRITVVPSSGPPVVVSLDGATVPPRWYPVRMVEVGGPRLRLDDADPDRDCFVEPVTGALPSADVREWSAALALAWAAVRVDVPESAAMMDRLITTVVPTRPVLGRPAGASTTRAAFGAMAMPLSSPRTLACLLVEKVATLTVAAVQDVCDLHVGSARSARSAPRARSSHVVGLTDAFGRVARLELMTAHVRAGRAVDRTAMSRLRESLTNRLECLDRGDRWTDAGRLLLAGLRGRLDRAAVV
jgi:uncharacterized protein